MKAEARVAVITSCFRMPFLETTVALGSVGVSSIDFYWPPEPEDLDELRRRGVDLSHGQGPWHPIQDAEKISAWLQERLATAEEKVKSRLGLVALTTSFPSMCNPVSQSDKDTLRANAIKCLVTLLRVAEILHIPSVQMRAGRRFYFSDKEKSYVFDSDAASITRLVASLREIHKQYNDQFAHSPRPGVALEIEPGEGFTLRGLDQVRLLQRRIAQVGELQNWVGLNLDIGHCLILKRGSSISPNDFLVRKKGSVELVLPIFGAHISDHSVHHAADLPPGVFHRAADFDPWINFYFKRVPELLEAKPEARARLTEHVSVELEAIGYLHQVARAHRVVSWRVHEKVVKSEVTKPREVTACILFADLRKSTIATRRLERKGMKALVDFTNELYQIFVSRMRSAYRFARLDKFIGDAAMMILEGDAEETLPAALEIAGGIQQNAIVASMRKLDKNFGGVGIGMTFGKVALTEVGPSPFAVETALGSEVIAASRLCDLAPSGAIWVSRGFKLALQECLKRQGKPLPGKWKTVGKKSKDGTVYNGYEFRP